MQRKPRGARKWSQVIGGARKPWVARSRWEGSKDEYAIRQHTECVTRASEKGRMGGASAGAAPSIHRCVGVREGADEKPIAETETTHEGIESDARGEGINPRASFIPVSWRTIGHRAPILRQQDIAFTETVSRVMSMTETTVRAQGTADAGAPTHRMVTSASATAGPSD